MLGKLSIAGAVAAILMIPHSAVRPSRGAVNPGAARSWCRHSGDSDPSGSRGFEFVD